jgi:macrolide transport system ATP-binding/permease protein
MLSVEGLCKSFGSFLVLNEVSFALNKGMRAGLVGANGVGKSTLLKVLARQEPADSGRISFAMSVNIGYLPQVPPSLSGKTIKELLSESAGDLRQLEARMREMVKAMSTSSGDTLDSLIEEYGEISRNFEEQGGYDLDHRTDIVLEGLGIGHLERSRAVNTLSGGERTRLGLAIVLLGSPGLLLLDEPTNHLDSRSLEWLENYLNKFQGGVIVASHDRQLLNSVVNWIFEIDKHTHRLLKYSGNYDVYKMAKEQERLKWEQDYKRQQEEISELKRIIRTTVSPTGRHHKPRDRDKYAVQFKEERLQTAASRTIRTARERLARILEDPVLKPPRPLRFKTGFKFREIRSAEVITVVGLSKSYGGKNILKDVSLTLSSHSRMIITGPNGSGKTTLLRILVGQENVDAGNVTYSPDLKIGYLAQELCVTPINVNVLEYYSRDLIGHREDFMAELLQCGLFQPDELTKNVTQLSPGQVRKLEIARMIANEPNTLLLDEPTNYISLNDLESFEDAIAHFPGPVLAVSHDRRFIRQFGGEVWELTDGKLLLQVVTGP